jgi:hypothetical protein
MDEKKPTTKPLAVPMSAEAAGKWRSRIDAGFKYVDRQLEDWKQQQASYSGRGLDEAPKDHQCVVNKDMPRVKQKVSQLFYQVPELALKPKAPTYADAVPVFQAVLNHKLTHEVKANTLVDEVLTDIIAVSGIGVSKIGYEVTVVEVDTEVPSVSPEEAAMLQSQGLPPPPPTIEKVPVPIHERYFWDRISPAKLIVPGEFTGTDFDRASYLGFAYRMPYSKAKELGYVSKEDDGTKRDEKVVTDTVENQSERTANEVECTEIWYKAYLFDPQVKNPLRHRRAVFVEGMELPVVHEDSPYQRFDEQGKLTIGMKKFPIRVLTLTTIPDEAYPPSDTKISRPLVSELQLSRSQMIKQRRRSLPLRWFNTSLVDPDVVAKIENGEEQDMIALTAPGDAALGEVARANYPRENFDFQRIIEQDLTEAWALGSNQLAGSAPGDQSATEANLMQTNANVRLDYERNKVLRWFLEGAELLGDLIQMFADEPDYIEVVGPDRAAAMQQWDKDIIAGEFVFQAKTNSQLRLDVSQERQDARNAYQLLANEPFINRATLVEWMVEAHGMERSRALTQPPEKKPDPPNVSFRFSGEELNPASPSFPIVMEVLKLGGFVIDPAIIQQAKMIAQANIIQPGLALAASGEPPPTPPPTDTEHGGPAEQAEPLSKSQLDHGDYR